MLDGRQTAVESGSEDISYRKTLESAKQAPQDDREISSSPLMFNAAAGEFKKAELSVFRFARFCTFDLRALALVGVFIS